MLVAVCKEFITTVFYCPRRSPIYIRQGKLASRTDQDSKAIESHADVPKGRSLLHVVIVLIFQSLHVRSVFGTKQRKDSQANHGGQTHGYSAECPRNG